MSESVQPDRPFMFLVRLEAGRKPRVCQVDAREVQIVVSKQDGRYRLGRRQPHAWRIREGGVAAIGNTVDEAFRCAQALL